MIVHQTPIDGERTLAFLANERLRVEIAIPGSPAYRGCRFDWTGFVTQVVLDDRHTFCGRESADGTGGIGLCNEFGIFNAIGYDDAAPGELFPKLGVGLLTKPDHQPYRFDREYLIRPFATDIIASESASFIEFVVQPEECRGYAARLTKRLTVRHNTLHVAYTLKNVGSRALVTQEYNHNFISIDHAPVGPDLILSAPGCLRTSENPLLAIDSEGIAWRRRPTDVFYAHEPTPPAGSRAWEMFHVPSGLGLREQTSAPWSAFALFGNAEIVSPEAFIDLNILPGTACHWSRTYTFFGPLDGPAAQRWR